MTSRVQNQSWKHFRRIRSFWYGITLPLESARLILSQKKLLIWSILPVGITLALYTWIIRSLQEWSQDVMNGWFENWGWSPEGWAAWSITFMMKMVLLLVAAVTFTFSSGIVASPFNDLLAEKAEAFAYPKLSPVKSQSIKMQIQLIGIDIVKTIAAGIAAICALVFSWIPILNILAFGIAFLLICFQYVSYPQTRRGVTIREGAHFLSTHLFASIGFGASVSFLFALPFLSVAALPLAVVGGTLLVARAPGNENIPPLK